MAARARLPRTSGLVGGTRYPRTQRFSSVARFSKATLKFAIASASSSMKTRPAAYLSFAGNSNPATARKNASGIWVRIPAPSPVPASEPTAPRCSRLRSASRAVATMSCPALPRSVATIARPQASLSNAGSYRPVRAGAVLKRSNGDIAGMPNSNRISEGQHWPTKVENKTLCPDAFGLLSEGAGNKKLEINSCLSLLHRLQNRQSRRSRRLLRPPRPYRPALPVRGQAGTRLARFRRCERSGECRSRFRG